MFGISLRGFLEESHTFTGHRWSSTSLSLPSAVPHGPVYSADHRDSTVVRIWWSMYAGRAVSQVPPWRRHSCSHSCSSLRICRPCFTLRKNCWFSAVAVHQGRSHSCRGAEADPHGPCDHGVSTVAVRYGFLRSCCACCVASQVQVVEVTVAIPQLHRVRHHRVVDIRVLTQRQFPLDQLFSRPLRFSSCSSLMWCSMSLLCGSTGQVVARPVVVDIPVMAERQVPLVLTVQADHRASPVAVH